MSSSFPLVSPTASGSDAADVVYIANPFAETIYVEALYVVPGVSVAQHAANYITVTVKDGSDTIAVLSTVTVTGVALTAGTPAAMTISGTGLVLEIPALSSITVDVTKAGTGPAYEFAVAARCRKAR